jgi:S-formylglutathione hydrolase FrmB
MRGRLTVSVLATVVLTLVVPLTSLAADVTVETITVHGPSLEGNLEGDTPDRPVIVYLPPSYASEPDRRYPVVYLLHGYGGGADTWNGLHDVAGRMQAAFAAGSRELIIVAPDAETVHLGSFYSSSVTIGDWETFVADDLVRHVDSHYRTIPTRDARAIAGFSMGGYGTFRLAMKRPDAFAVAYAMSSCCLAPVAGGARFAALEQLETLEDASDLGLGRVSLALAAAWAPSPTRPPFYFDTPTLNGEPQPEVVAALGANAGITMLHQHVPALESLSAIGVEIGLQDNLLAGNERMHELLEAYGIEHQWETYEGGHGDRLGERIEGRMLPFFSEHLRFEP